MFKLRITYNHSFHTTIMDIQLIFKSIESEIKERKFDFVEKTGNKIKF